MQRNTWRVDCVGPGAYVIHGRGVAQTLNRNGLHSLVAGAGLPSGGLSVSALDLPALVAHARSSGVRLLWRF